MDEDSVPLGSTPLEPPQEKDIVQQEPWFIVQSLVFVEQFASNYGWLLMFLSIIVYYTWKKAKPKVQKWEELREAAFYHKNPDLYIARDQKLTQARQRMQEKYEKLSTEHAIKVEQAKAEEAVSQPQPEEKPKPKVKQNATGSTFNRNTKKPLRPEYNPLMGGGSSSYYRPARSTQGG